MQITTMLSSFDADGMRYIVFNGYPGEKDLTINTLGEKIYVEHFIIDLQTNEIEDAEELFKIRQTAAMLHISDKVRNNRKS